MAPHRWTKGEAARLAVLTLLSHKQWAVVLCDLEEISLDNMKVISAVLLVAVFWSQEWKSVLSDSIIHIGELLRVSLGEGHHKEGPCASLRKHIGGFSCAVRPAE